VSEPSVEELQRLEALSYVAKASLGQNEVNAYGCCQGRSYLIGVVGEQNYLCFREQTLEPLLSQSRS
jgi:hypothetical protein